MRLTRGEGAEVVYEITAAVNGHDSIYIGHANAAF
jgi:hypothetical protein